MTMSVVLIAVGATWFGVSWMRRGAHEVSVDDALQRFRETPGHDVVGTDGLQPAAGVYTYEGRGSESLSVLGTKQQWGDTIPATVVHGPDGCWTLTVDFNTHHSQSWRYCAQDDSLVERGGKTSQTFDFVAFSATDVNTFTCAPPAVVLRDGAQRGTPTAVECEGRSAERGTVVASTGTNTYVGREELMIGSAHVAAYHVRSEREMSGDQEGTDRSDAWYAVRGGMLLRLERDIEVRSPSPVGTVTYTERGRIELTSLTARR
jgi:hypothetical protein